MLVTEPKFIIKDGAVYFSVFDNVLVPLAGGGASGCFSLDLPERIEKLKNLTKTFPYLPPAR
jgi:hypothetical protein